MRETMYKLSRLVEDANNLHKAIEPDRPIVVDMHGELPYYYKIECTEGYQSPILINIDDLDGKKCRGLRVYGSYVHKEPQEGKCEVKLQDARKIKIREPRGKEIFMALPNLGAKPGKDDEEDSKQHMVFYIMMTSKSGIKARLTASATKINFKANKKEKVPTKKEGDEKDFTGNFVVRL